MGRRESAEAKILRLFDSLSDEGKRIVFDLLRAKQQPVGKLRRKSAAPAAPRPSSLRKSKAERAASTETNGDGAGDVVSELAKVTGRSYDDCKAALATAGNKKDAMLALTSN